MIDKTAATAVPIQPVLAQRWSPRTFSGREIDSEILSSLFEAARWAPSCFNDQPWHFIIAIKSDRAEYDRLLSCLTDANQAWAQTVPVLGLAIARLQFQRNQKPNRHALYDTGQALAHLTFEAASRGLYVHQMAGFSAQKARDSYQIPADYEPITAFALGYLGDIDRLPEEQRRVELAERTRKPTADFVFSQTWGQAAPFIHQSGE